MTVDLGARARWIRPLTLLAALAGWALVPTACLNFGGGGSGGRAGTGGTGGGGAGGQGTGGTAGQATGGTGGATVDAGSDAPLNLDGPDDSSSGDPDPCSMDSDYDGTPDCNDGCPGDPSKTEPKMCGCYVAETDTDHDGTPDCNDGCPNNADRTMPGLCGCALPDSAAPLCLAHRYSFDDATGATTVRDSVGTANGTAMNVTLPGTGTLTLAGGTSDQYVALPSGIISALGNNATFEAWITWTGTGGAWQRVFDFGANDMQADGGQGMLGTAFVFFTPLSGAGVELLSVNTVGLTEVMGPGFFPAGAMTGGQPHHLACVVDAKIGDGGTPSARLYVDGTLIGTTGLTSVLSGLNDAHNWLGRSQFGADPEFQGTYYEFRIYSIALTQDQINASIGAGPERLP